LEGLDVDGRTKLERILEKQNVKMCTEFMSLRLEASGRLLVTP